jgi:hypothetical protein
MDPRTTDPKLEHGSLMYHQAGGLDPLPASDVLHLAMFGWDGIKGYSPIEIGRETLGVAASQRDYQAGLFNNSAAAQGHLEVPGNLKTLEKSQLRNYWNKIHQGPQLAGNIGILEGGMKWVQTNFSPQDAALIEGCAFSVEEIARLWNLPQHKLNKLDNANFSTVEQMNLDFYTSSILPWLTAIEKEIDLKLLTRIQRRVYFAFFNFGYLLRADQAAQTARDVALFGLGARSPNDLLVADGKEPVDDPRFDFHYLPVNNLQAIETMPSASPAEASPEADQVEADQLPAATPPEGAPVEVEDVQAAAMNGAQIASLLSITQQVAAGLLPVDSARGIIAASFPTLTPAQVDAILAPLGNVPPAPSPATSPATSSSSSASSPTPADASALRAVLSDPIGRMVRREAQAARRASRKGDIEAWADSFYPDHQAVFASAIGPALRLVDPSVDNATWSEMVAGGMSQTSRQQIRDLVVTVPPDEMPGAVDRMCDRWEASRAGDLVEALIPIQSDTEGKP